MIDCSDEQLMEEVRLRGFVIRDAQIGAKWVGLTDEERSYYLQAAANVGWWQAALFVEAKLKEKNGG
jgi:hypothetical protein